jgi:hypothetical protein
MDFVALLRYRRTADVVGAIDALEGQTSPVLAHVRPGGGFAAIDRGRSCWVSHGSGRQVERPRGPDVSAALRTVEGFHLTFGRDACCVYYPLRWLFFLTDPAWQRAMLEACDAIADLLESPDGAVMSDFHPAYGAFFQGCGYDECLRAATPGEGEVASLTELFRLVDPDGTWDSRGYWCFRRDGLRTAGPTAATPPSRSRRAPPPPPPAAPPA